MLVRNVDNILGPAGEYYFLVTTVKEGPEGLPSKTILSFQQRQ